LAISHILVDRPFHSWRIERIRDETSAIFVSSGLPTLLRRDFPATRDGRFVSEFIVNEGAAQWVKDILAGEYPNVFFTIMLNPSALKAEGTQEEVAQVARELSYGQSYRIYGLPDADFLLPVRYAELDVVKESIETLIPELELRVVDNYRLLFAVGPREAIAAARGLLLELDRPTEVE